MEKAKTYGIKRAVLEPEINEKQYNLNKSIINNDKNNVLVVNEKNILEIIEKIYNTTTIYHKHSIGEYLHNMHLVRLYT